MKKFFVCVLAIVSVSSCIKSDANKAEKPLTGDGAANVQSPANSSTATPASSNVNSAARSDRGTPDEAMAMLEKAIERYNSAGRETALADFNNKKPPFSDRDLYVVCIGPDRKISANGGFRQYVGTSSDAWKDADGHSLGKAIWDSATNA